MNDNITPITKRPSIVGKSVPETNFTILNHCWYSGVDVVGIVLVEDKTTKKTKAYIGVGRKGNNEQEDIYHIAKWGAKVPRNMAETQFGRLPDFAW